MKYLITGVAGTGKSSTARDLQKRGYAAFDADSGFSYWVEKATGKKAQYPDVPTFDWYEHHERVFDETVLKDIFNDHPNEPVFICSITANQQKFYPEFNKIFLLVVEDKNVLIHRINTRTDNPYGKHSVELTRVLSRQKAFNDELKALHAIVIDAIQPIEKITNEILSHVEDKTSHFPKKSRL